ncbi:MAG: leucine-rich repeat domain-containing protein [Dehalococcoidia bacterium]|nr:leucine-rich repeat domain-containing protein [Dehalococcoidia bacterium]
MNRMLSSRRHRHIRRVSLYLLVVTLIAGVTGCVGEASRTVKYDLTIASGEGGSVTVPGEGTFACDAGRVVDLLATPTSGYRFAKWTGAVGTIANVNAPATAITVNGNYSIRATFQETEATYYGLTVGVTGSGSTSPTVGQHTYAAGAVISIIATPASGYRFVGWSGDMGTIANVNAASTTITMNGNYSIIANFEETAVTYYTLTMAATGVGSINPAVGQHSYAAGTVVPIIASAAGGYYFVNWTGNVGTVANVNAASSTITMSGNYSITANFEVAAPYTLTMAIAGGGSTSPAVGQHTYTAGTPVSITANPASGYYFSHWTAPAGSFTNASSATTTFNMPAQDVTVTANLVEGPPTPPDQYTLTMAVAGSGSTSPAEGQHTYTVGTPVPITATPAGGYSFSHWTAPAGSFTNASSATTTFTMPAQAVTVTAHFEMIPPFQYTLTMAVAGSGSTSPAVGQHTYAGGTMVPIVATPTGGYRFVNWTAPAGSFTNANSATTTFTMPAQAVTVTANFAVIPPIQYSLAISSTAGGSVTTPGEGTFIRNAGTVVNLAATPAGGYAFVNWTGNVGTIANVNAAYTTITMNGNYSITANFELGDWVFFPDPALEAALRAAIGKPTGRIYKSDLEGLVSFSATGKSIINLTGLEHCTNLVSLDLHDNQISDISPLADLTKLEWLDLSYNRISDVSPLAGLTNLKWLYLYNNRIGNISPLANLTNLLYLYLHSNQISNISPLANLTNLARLFLFSNQISDISPLTNLTKLTWLYLQENQISNIGPLTNLTNLIQLDLSDNQVSGIAPLANLTNLTYLSVHSNQISDISVLANLVNLMWLYLQNDLITNIYPLVQNGGLGTGDRVYLGGNPLSGDSISIYIPELTARGVIVSY